MEAIWRRLNDVTEEFVVLMTLMGLSPSFGTKRRPLKSPKHFPSRKICDKKL
jgi:hypothetical protein